MPKVDHHRQKIIFYAHYVHLEKNQSGPEHARALKKLIYLLNQYPDVFKNIVLDGSHWDLRYFKSVFNLAISVQSSSLLKAAINHPRFQQLSLKQKQQRFLDMLLQLDIIEVDYEFLRVIIDICDREGLIKPPPLNSQLIFQYFHPEALSTQDFTETFDDYYHSFSRENFWRLFCDSELQSQELGWYDFEQREPGYLLAMTKAHLFMRQTINEPLTMDLIKQLHAKATDNVKHMVKKNHSGQLRHHTESLRYGVSPSTSLRGLVQSIRHSLRYEDYDFTTSGYGQLYHLLYACDIKLVAKKFKRILSHYQLNIFQAVTAKDYLLAIATLISRLEKLHPFIDGNTRTFSMLLLNRELIRHGFSPSMLFNPNVSGCYCRERLANEIAEGMKRFQQCLDGKYYAHGNKTTKQLLTTMGFRHGDNTPFGRTVWQAQCRYLNTYYPGRAVSSPPTFFAKSPKSMATSRGQKKRQRETKPVGSSSFAFSACCKKRKLTHNQVHPVESNPRYRLLA